MSKIRIIPASDIIQITEDIQGYTYVVEEDLVAVTIMDVDDTKPDKLTFKKDGNHGCYHIQGQDFIDLMAENGGPENLCLGKPAGSFRLDDLWPFVVKVRGF